MPQNTIDLGGLNNTDVFPIVLEAGFWESLLLGLQTTTSHRVFTQSRVSTLGSLLIRMLIRAPPYNLT